MKKYLVLLIAAGIIGSAMTATIYKNCSSATYIPHPNTSYNNFTMNRHENGGWSGGYDGPIEVYTKESYHLSCSTGWPPTAKSHFKRIKQCRILH